MRKIFQLSLMVIFMFTGACSQAQSTLPTTKVTLINPLNTTESYTFTAEKATTYKQRQKGLMHRKSLPKNGAMIFLYPNEKAKPRQFWMKNTPLPLTIIFTHEGIVKYIERRAKPYSTDNIGSSTEPVDAVLEISAEHPAAQKIQLGWILKQEE